MTLTSDNKQTKTDNLITATIDGIQVQVPKGTLIIRAAERMGTFVPRFCDHPALAPVADESAADVVIATGVSVSLDPLNPAIALIPPAANRFAYVAAGNEAPVASCGVTYTSILSFGA